MNRHKKEIFKYNSKRQQIILKCFDIKDAPLLLVNNCMFNRNLYAVLKDIIENNASAMPHAKNNMILKEIIEHRNKEYYQLVERCNCLKL